MLALAIADWSWGFLRLAQQLEPGPVVRLALHLFASAISSRKAAREATGLPGSISHGPGMGDADWGPRLWERDG